MKRRLNIAKNLRRTNLRAIIFDFDGLILDTETPAYQSWVELYAEYGCTLPLSDWEAALGTAPGTFEACDYLEGQIGRAIEREQVLARRLARKSELTDVQPILPGVARYIEEAGRLGLGLAVASSSSRDWVGGHLRRLGLLDCFGHLLCRDDVSDAKPHPALYRAALAALGVEADQAIAIEDSPNGIAAAKAAGLFCVAVPNAITARLSVDHADLVLPSLEALPLVELLRLVERRRDAACSDAEPAQRPPADSPTASGG